MSSCPGSIVIDSIVIDSMVIEENSVQYMLLIYGDEHFWASLSEEESVCLRGGKRASLDRPGRGPRRSRSISFAACGPGGPAAPGGPLP
jgi:hypothetical protein